MPPIGIAVGLPFGGRLVHPRWAVALKTLDFPLNTQQELVLIENRPIAEARNLIAEHAIKRGVKYLFFLDDDVIVPRHAIQALGYDLDQGLDDKTMVATGVYCTKSFVPTPVIFRDDTVGPLWDWRINDVFDIDGAGCGCMLINTDVFKHLEPPYFADTESYKDNGTGETVLTMVSEDIYFCRKVREAGFKIKADGRVICSHYDEKQNKFHELPEDSIPYKRERARQEEILILKAKADTDKEKVQEKQEEQEEQA